VRRLILALGAFGIPLLALSGCASQGYGSGGGGFDDYEDCYDDGCVGYDAYGRSYYRRPEDPRLAERGDVDRVDRSHGSTRTVDRSGARPTSTSTSLAAAAPRMSVARPAPPPPAPTTASRPR
jgi:hypothetical protein